MLFARMNDALEKRLLQLTSDIRFTRLKLFNSKDFAESTEVGPVV
jgi:hypothetical protein